MASAQATGDGVVRLGPWSDADAGWYAATVTGDAEIQRFTSEPPDQTAEKVRAGLAGRDDVAAFLVRDAVTGERLGNIAVNRAGEVTYWLAPEARGRGVATRALRLVSAYARDRWPGTDLLLWTHPDNVASQRVALRAGYQREPALDRTRAMRGTEWRMVGYRLPAPPAAVEVPGIGQVHPGALGTAAGGTPRRAPCHGRGGPDRRMWVTTTLHRPARPARRLGYRFSAGVVALTGAVFIGFGLWAFLAPHSFATAVVALPPYNRHLTHDVGAFQLGIGAALWAALFVRDGLGVALLGASVGTVVHLLSHIVDDGLGGGHDADPWLLGLLAALVVAATVVRLRLERPDR